MLAFHRMRLRHKKTAATGERLKKNHLHFMSNSALEIMRVLAPATACIICRSKGRVFCSSEIQTSIGAIGSELEPGEHLADPENAEEVGLEARSPPPKYVKTPTRAMGGVSKNFLQASTTCKYTPSKKRIQPPSGSTKWHRLKPN